MSNSDNNKNTPIKRIVFTVLGCIFLGLGSIGVVIPVLPTTPFVLLAAVLFSVGNPQLFNWLKKNPVFGSYIENYRTKRGISRSLKVGSILFLWTGLAISMFIIKSLWAYIALPLIGVCVTIHLVMIKTRKD